MMYHLLILVAILGAETVSAEQSNPLCSTPDFGGEGLVNFGCTGKTGGSKLMPKLIYNGRNEIDWNNYGVSLDEILCKCKRLAEATGEQYATFGIQFYGECWASTFSAEHIILRSQMSATCVDKQFEQCVFNSNGNATLCSGVADSTFLYSYSTLKARVSEKNNIGLWTTWTECSQTCGRGGFRERVSICESELPCEHQLEECTVMENCMSNWEEWTTCSTTCGVGSSRRVRECMSEGMSEIDCPGPLEEHRHCLVDKCETDETDGLFHIHPLPTLYPGQVNGAFGQWSSWSECNRSCGLGTSQRRRECDSPPPSNGGFECIGKRHQTSDCLLRYCPAI